MLHLYNAQRATRLAAALHEERLRAVKESEFRDQRQA